MSVQSYFYDQRRKHPAHKRIKKSSDDYSLFGDHRSFNKAIKKKISLTFSDQGDLTDGAASTVNSVQGLRPKSGRKRPGTAHSWKQLSTAKEATPKASPNALLPQISSNLSAGPTSPTNIVSQPSKHSTSKTTDIKLSPAKLKVLEAVESEKPEINKDTYQKYTFSELKFLATGILSQLSKLLFNYKPVKDLCIISEELESDLLRDFYQLCCDVVVDKREWQTDCYLDQHFGSRPFFTSVPEEEERVLIESNLKKTEAVLEQKKVKMSDTAKKTKSSNRPATSHSRASLHSAVSSDFGPISIAEDDKESRLAPSEYDLLPSSLCPRGPTILSYKRESMIKPFEFAGPKTRFEKFKQSTVNKRRKSTKKGIDVSVASKQLTEPAETTEQPPEQRQPYEDAITTAMYHGANMINFSMCDKFLKKGWIVCPDERKDPEGFTLLQWAKSRLSKIIEERIEAEVVAKQRGEDGPLIIKFYDEIGNRTNRRQMKTLILPVPPGVRIGAAKTTVQVPVDAPTEPSRKRFLTLLSDGSGFCNYPSGHTAITTCRRGDGSRGLYAFVYSDEALPKMLAWFTPYGKMGCYHSNGSLWLLADSDGGMLLDEDGHKTRQWTWPTASCKLPQSVMLQLNNFVTFRCYSHMNAFLHFTAYGTSYKFDVAMKQDFKDPQVNQSNSTTTLMTNFKFSSFAAAEASGKPIGLLKKRDYAAASAKTSISRASSSISENVFTGSTNCAEDELIAKELGTYQEKIKSLVDNWLGYYRGTLGVKKAPVASSRVRSSLLSRSHTVSPRSVFSSREGDMSRPMTRLTSRLHSRSSTYPMSSRPTSELGRWNQVSPQPIKTSRIMKQSPSKNYVSIKLRTEESMEKIKNGCPEALRTMRINKLSSLPQCKCNRHKLPLLHDDDIDVFLGSHVPSDQLVIIYITHDSEQKPTTVEAMLDTIHINQHKNRASPCMQLFKENYRILKYDLATCVNPGKEGILPLLVSRHNVQPGMFLMYFNGKLVTADHIFNGYSNQKKDLQKQIDKSIADGKKGLFLPKDFKLHSENKLLQHVKFETRLSTDSLLNDSLSASQLGSGSLLGSMHRLNPAVNKPSPLHEKAVRQSTQVSVKNNS